MPPQRRFAHAFHHHIRRHIHRLIGLALALLWAGAWLPAKASDVDPAAQARAVYAEVNQNAPRMATQRWRARVPGVDYTSEVVAWLERGKLRKLSVTDADDSGNVLTDLYFGADGALVFALRTTQGFAPSGAVQTRNEHRLYFQQGQLVRMLAGLSKTLLPLQDALARTEAATVWTMAQSLQAAVSAPPPPTVPVGSLRKLAQGKVLGLERGDAACHIELVDAAGRVHREMADFALCDSAERWIGRTVSLAYGQARVMAASCQGNVACTRSDVVTLVTGATLVPARPASPVAAVAPAVPAPAAAASPSWCGAAETDLFTCQIGRQRVSVCASEGASAQRGSLFYRFGPAAGGAPDMVLPRRPTVPANSATGEASPFAGGGGAWLRFAHGDHAYVVYSGVGRWGRNGETETREGVQVQRNGKPVATLHCERPSANELGPDWLQRLGIAPNAQGFEFPNTGR